MPSSSLRSFVRTAEDIGAHGFHKGQVGQGQRAFFIAVTDQGPARRAG